MIADSLVVFPILLLLSVSIDAQRDSKWSWAGNNNIRNNVEERRQDRPIDRRKFERLEDLGDRYEVSEGSTKKPHSQNDYFNNGYGFDGQNGITGNGYNGNAFGPFGPQGQGAYPQNVGPNNQFGGAAYNPAFGGYRPGSPGPGFVGGQGFGAGGNGYYPGGIGNGAIGNGYYPGNGFGPNNYFPGAYGPQPGRYPYGNNPINNAASGLVGPGGVYGRPQQFGQQPFNGPYNNGYYNGPYNQFGPYGNPGFGSFGQSIPFNSKSGTGILADENTDQNKNETSKHK